MGFNVCKHKSCAEKKKNADQARQMAESRARQKKADQAAQTAANHNDNQRPKSKAQRNDKQAM